MAPKNLAILVHDDVEVLDFCGPFEAFGVTGDDGQAHFNVFTVADEARVVRANTGMLIQPNGLEATTHYSGHDRLQKAAPTAVVRRDVRVADNGHIVTGAGVSAGIDLALHMIGRMYGMEEARAVAEYMMYRWAPEDEARTEALIAS
jgi:transcriptional regulator GlxA family with amidase domain